MIDLEVNRIIKIENTILNLKSIEKWL